MLLIERIVSLQPVHSAYQKKSVVSCIFLFSFLFAVSSAGSWTQLDGRSYFRWRLKTFRHRWRASRLLGVNCFRILDVSFEELTKTISRSMACNPNVNHCFISRGSHFTKCLWRTSLHSNAIGSAQLDLKAFPDLQMNKGQIHF